LFYIYNLYIKAELCFEHKQNYSCGNFELTKSAVKKIDGGHKNPLIQRGIFSTIGSSWDDIGVNDFSDIKNIDLITMAMTAMKRQIRGFLLASFSIVGCWVDQTSNIHIKYDIFDI